VTVTRPVLLVILDGFGLAADGPGNAVARASTPVFDRIWRERPRTTLRASGEAVGLPAGQMGNSEVGHLNIGAGRVVRQSLTHIQALIDDGSFYDNQVLVDTYGSVAPGGTLHLMGLVSDGGVHSDLRHLLALIELAGRRRVARLRVHAFTDGRDSAPDGGLEYLRTVERALADLSARTGCDARVGSVVGRYYAMDRDLRWERTKLAYDAVVCGRAQHSAPTGVAAVEAAYSRGETDEFIAATIVDGSSGGASGAGITSGDGVVFFNFRADRARQLTRALLVQDFTGFERCTVVTVRFASLMEYDAALPASYAFSLPVLDLGLSEVVSRAGLRQYHTAETEKYAHVTYFFNLQREEPFDGEERFLVPSPKVPTYDMQPAMSAPELTERTVERILTGVDDFLLINYANPDMVGHTGVMAAAVAACEAADTGLGRLLAAVTARGGAAIVIADHGNAEVMLTPTGEPHTAHTTNPVPCVLVSDAPELAGASLRGASLAGASLAGASLRGASLSGVNRAGASLADAGSRDEGALCDVAPTVLDLLGLPQPVEMTGVSLLRRRASAR
jgi:2,3-bisphosphoglycerate-independent phosphoglycerate mutase